MGSTQVYHDAPYLIEVWVLFGVGVCVFLARFIVRLRTVGYRGFAGDDYMAIVVLACYTADAITVTIAYKEGTNVDYTAKQVERLTAAQVKSIEYGSKMQLLAWYTYTALNDLCSPPSRAQRRHSGPMLTSDLLRLVWGLKACMLFFYHRITFGLPQERYVKALAVSCAVTYLAMFLTITLSCLPLHWNWQVTPKPPERCELRIQNFYVCTILNVLTDGALLAVPIPLLWRLRIPLRKKVTIGVLMSSGIFVITAALTRIIMTLKENPSATVINKWGVRETIAGIIAVNAPILQPLLKKSFYTRGAGVAPPMPRPPQLDPELIAAELKDDTSGGKSKDDSLQGQTSPKVPTKSVTAGSEAWERPMISLPPVQLNRPAVMTPIEAELHAIERIDTRLDHTPRSEIAMSQDQLAERSEYFGSTGRIGEHRNTPAPVPLEIIDGQQLFVPLPLDPLTEPAPPDLAASRWSQRLRPPRLPVQLRTLNRAILLRGLGKDNGAQPAARET